MEEKKRGGKRNGAGRKPIGNLRKKQISLFVEGAFIWKFGGEEKMKESLYKYIKEFGEVKVSATPKNGFDAPSPAILNGEPSKPMSLSEQFFLEATSTKSKTELEDVLKRAKKEMEYFPYQRLVDATKHLFDNFFND